MLQQDRLEAAAALTVSQLLSAATATLASLIQVQQAGAAVAALHIRQLKLPCVQLVVQLQALLVVQQHQPAA